MKSKVCVILVVTMIIGIVTINGLYDGRETTQIEIKQERGNISPIKVGISIYGRGNKTITRFTNALLVRAQSMKLDVTLFKFNYDTNDQEDHIRQMIADRVDVIIIGSESKDIQNRCIDYAIKADIPIIAIDNFKTLQQPTCIVSIDDREIGRIIGHYLINRLNNKGSITILGGGVGRIFNSLQLEGIKEVLKEHSDIVIYSAKCANWSEVDAKIVVDRWMNTFDKIDAIIAENGEMGLGAIKAVEQAGQSVIVITEGNTKEILGAIKKGEVALTINSNIERQGEKVMEIIDAILEKQSVHKYYAIPFECITEENVDEYIK